MAPLIGSDNIVSAPSGYKFAIPSFDNLGAAEYTLVGIAVDHSGSTGGFEAEMEACLKEIVLACKKSPRAENLMLRMIKFNHKVTEVHGFRLLKDIADTEYDNTLSASGETALYDSSYALTESVAEYGRMLIDGEHAALVNAIVFVITDGMDNRSKFTPDRVRQLVESIRSGEKLESILVILIGIGTGCQSYLDTFTKDAKLDQFVPVAEAKKGHLAKLAQFVSKSVSSQSKALGTGGASKTLTF